MITLKIAIRNIFRHRTRTIITLSAIAFGCISLIFVGGFFEDTLWQMRESYIRAHTGHLQVFKTGFFEKGNAHPFDYLIDNPQEIISLTKDIPEIQFVTSRIEFSGLLSTGDNTISFIGQGIEPKNEPGYIFSEEKLNLMRENTNIPSTLLITKGDSLKETDAYDVVLGKGLAAGIEAKVGDGLILLANTVGGSINALDVNVKGIFLTSAKAFDDRFLRLNLATAQKLLQTNSVLSLMIRLNKTEDTIKVKDRLQELFKGKNMDLEIKTWVELSDFYTKTEALFNRQFLILKLVIGIVVILSIFNTMNMAVLERTGEIGTIMALGTKKSGVLNLFLYEGIALGLIGGVIGIAAGSIITYLVSIIGIPMPPAPGATFNWLSQPKVVPSVLIFTFLLSLFTSLISSLFPAYKASKLEIASALRFTA